MRSDKWLRDATHRLEAAGISTARLDALVLLEDVTGKDRSWLLAHPEFSQPDETFHKLDLLIARREKHEPLAYIREKSEFYGREFSVNEHVLVPRPESETMIELLIAECGVQDTDCTIIDVGTGSGALAITAKLELPNAPVVAIDIDPNCLSIASRNAKKYNADLTFLEGDLLEPLLNSKFGIQNSCILANLPYVPNDYGVNRAAKHEPSLALYGGPDGLDAYRALFMQIASGSLVPESIITEALPSQHAELHTIAQAYGYKEINKQDLVQVFVPIISA